MRSKNYFLKTHRCTGSLKAGVSIRFQPSFIDNHLYWFILHYDFDGEWDRYVSFFVAHINYCPFCGQQLTKEGETYDSE